MPYGKIVADQKFCWRNRKVYTEEKRLFFEREEEEEEEEEEKEKEKEQEQNLKKIK